jgi:hypothetical protein
MPERGVDWSAGMPGAFQELDFDMVDPYDD